MTAADTACAVTTASRFNLTLPVARLLTGRGLTSESDIKEFLNPSLTGMLDPLLLKGVDAAVSRLVIALRNEEPVCIYGDYDVDGITGTSLLVSFLRRVGFSCEYFIPNRFDDGYGLNQDSLARIISDGSTLIMSVDCGITSVDEAAFCRGTGVDLIILDHHLPKNILPDAAAVVNPLQPDCPYPFKSLSGVGVAFNLLVALRSRLRSEGVFDQTTEPDLREWLYLVALGTIADVVSLTGQNRIYVCQGLKQLNSGVGTGIAALKKAAGISGDVSCGQVGFRLAPRLNAAGRMESAVPGVELLLSSDPQECGRIAAELDAANAERQSVERSIFEDAVSQLEKSGRYPACRSIVLGSPDWHQGVVGIVASRIVERYHRPTLLLAFDEEGNGKGSGRSIPGFHLLDAVSECSGYLTRFGGHRYAAGIGLPRERFADFTAAFETAAVRQLGSVNPVPVLTVDTEVLAEELTIELVNDLKRLEPFGAGNPEPTLLLRRVTAVDRRVVGGSHLKLKLAVGAFRFDAIAFRQSDLATEGVLDVAFFPELNVWNGRTSLQLRIKDIRQAEE
ncbi:MAG: single-stranded-DNA-specific exonuclease RecJ [Desulfuromonadales bacterium]